MQLNIPRRELRREAYVPGNIDAISEVIHCLYTSALIVNLLVKHYIEWRAIRGRYWRAS